MKKAIFDLQFTSVTRSAPPSAQCCEAQRTVHIKLAAHGGKCCAFLVTQRRATLCNGCRQLLAWLRASPLIVLAAPSA